MALGQSLEAHRWSELLVLILSPQQVQCGHMNIFIWSYSPEVEFQIKNITFCKINKLREPLRETPPSNKHTQTWTHVQRQICRPLGYERVYLPLCKVEDIQGGDVYTNNNNII